jgi:hypothetical protein
MGRNFANALSREQQAMTSSSIQETGARELRVDVRDINHLFVAPDIDPLSVREGEVVGEPALLRIVRKLMATRELDLAYKLVVHVPADRIDPALEERTRIALSRYSAIKIEDNEAQLRIMRREAGGLLVRGMLILLVCMGLSSLFNSETIPGIPPLIATTLGEGFNVLGWVMLWGPIEAYFFNPLPLHASNTAHRFLQKLRLEIRPAPAE